MASQPPFTSPFGASPSTDIPHMDWNPSTMLDNLTFIEDKIKHVKDVIRSMVHDLSRAWAAGHLSQQQQHVNAELTCLIVQLISTAGSLLPSLQNSSFLSHPQAGHITNYILAPSRSLVPNPAITDDNNNNVEQMQSPDDHDYVEFFKGLMDGAVEDMETDNNILADVQEIGEGGSDAAVESPTLTHEVHELEEDQILAPHTHFCSICGKGFKRDTNRRMHMRGHGDEYKNPAALARPPRDASTEERELMKRYSCPFVGCQRNKLHNEFQRLKTVQSLKNHYRRSHCEKRYSCSRCHVKKFSIMADLKTHEKHCGRTRWRCSCGTSFSRKDRLFAHVALFLGHTPALPLEAPRATDTFASNQERQENNGSFMGEQGSFMWGNSSGDDSILRTNNMPNDCGSDDFLSTEHFGFSFGPDDEFTGYPSMQGSFAMLPPEYS